MLNCQLCYKQKLFKQPYPPLYMQGRGGKGSIYTWAAGNGGEVGDSCAADGYASSIYTIAIGAAWSDGTPASYDEPCSAKMATNFMDSDTLKVVCVSVYTRTRTCTCTPTEADPRILGRGVQRKLIGN